MVLARDVPDTVRMRGADHLAAALILDVDTGLVRGIAIEQSTEAALGQAVGAALNEPAAELPPGPPARVLCAPGLTGPVRAELAAAGISTEDATLVEVQPGPEAEDIFDSFLGHLSGRTQPHQPPSPTDWQQLIDDAGRLRQAEPWVRWSDEQELAIELYLADGTATYTAVVMGQAGIQHGLALYPGDQLPAGLRDPAAGEQPAEPPAGTLLLMLNPPDELPGDLRARAIRYGWPADDDLIPAFMTFTTDGPAEISQDDAHRLTAGIAAVLAVDRRGPTLAEAADRPVTGTIRLDGRSVRFAARHRPRRDQPAEPRLRLHLAGHDLLPPETPVTVGHLNWEALAELRGAATVHRPAPPDAPPPAGTELPLIVLSPDPDHGPALAAKIAQLDPYGVAVLDSGAGEHALVLAGGEAAEILLTLPNNHPALTAFQRRYRQTHGRHAILIADQASATGQGRLYGLFECHQPPPPHPRPTTTKTKPKTNPARRPKRKP